MANQFSLMISHDESVLGSWSYPLQYEVAYDQNEVVFINQAALACKIVFSDRSTFGTTLLSIAPESFLSVNIYERNCTDYVVVGHDEATPTHITGPGLHTIEVNNAPLTEPCAYGTSA